MSPTYLSRCQSVSKNTISSLIGGLEEQGWSSASWTASTSALPHPFTDAGRRAVQETAPEHVAYLNALAGGLTSEERCGWWRCWRSCTGL